MPGWRSISLITRWHLLRRANQGIDVFDRLVIGIMGHRRARYRVEGLAGGVRDQMHVEEAAHAGSSAESLW